MAKKRALLMVRVDPPAERETEWCEWYDNKHIADRLALPGFLSARRFVALDTKPKYLTLYDLDDVGVLDSPAYLKLRDWEKDQPPDSFAVISRKLPNFSRGVYEQLSPGEGYHPPQSEFVFVVGQDVPANRDEEFNAWYNTEHLAAVLKVPGFLSGRRFKVYQGKLASPVGAESQYLAVYDLASNKVLESKEFKTATDTPWGAWVRSWQVRKLRGQYQRIFPKP